VGAGIGGERVGFGTSGNKGGGLGPTRKGDERERERERERSMRFRVSEREKKDRSKERVTGLKVLLRDLSWLMHIIKIFVI
jgi:hypothetical protein